MADFLTHLFLPLTAAYIIWPERFPSHTHLILGGFGLLSDFDKFLGTPGLLHSLVTLVPIALVIVLFDRWWYGELTIAPVILFMTFSHLVLDLLDGGPVPLLFPFVAGGIGLYYPAQIVFDAGIIGLTVDGPLIAFRTATPRTGFNAYGFINGFGITSLLLFLIVYWRNNWPSYPRS